MTKKLLLFLLVLFCTVPLAADLPRIAVYVTGDVPENEKKALGTRMLSSLINSGRYMGIERSNSFLAEIEKEQTKQRSGAIDDGQISELGKQFGIKYVCIADITPAFGTFQVSARIVDVETAVVVHIGEAFSPLRGAQDLMQASDEVVRGMFGRQAASTLKPAPTPESTPKPMLQNAVQQPRPTPARTTKEEIKDGKGKTDRRSAMPKSVDSRPPKHSLGILAGTSGVEPHLRLGMTTHSRIYSGLGLWWGNKDVWSGHEVHLGGFIEWHTNNDLFNLYGGPGLLFGIYGYEYPTSLPDDSGVGGALGVQCGIELRFGRFLIGTDIRLAFYIRQWDSGTTGTVGIRSGTAF